MQRRGVLAEVERQRQPHERFGYLAGSEQGQPDGAVRTSAGAAVPIVPPSVAALDQHPVSREQRTRSPVGQHLVDQPGLARWSALRSTIARDRASPSRGSPRDPNRRAGPRAPPGRLIAASPGGTTVAVCPPPPLVLAALASVAVPGLVPLGTRSARGDEADVDSRSSTTGPGLGGPCPRTPAAAALLEQEWRFLRR